MEKIWFIVSVIVSLVRKAIINALISVGVDLRGEEEKLLDTEFATDEERDKAWFLYALNQVKKAYKSQLEAYGWNLVTGTLDPSMSMLIMFTDSTLKTITVDVTKCVAQFEASFIGYYAYEQFLYAAIAHELRHVRLVEDLAKHGKVLKTGQTMTAVEYLACPMEIDAFKYQGMILGADLYFIPRYQSEEEAENGYQETLQYYLQN